eukprot:SAG11_NODE_1936_length_4032_cov_8.888380_3_plen_154_part_00
MMRGLVPAVRIRPCATLFSRRQPVGKAALQCNAARCDTVAVAKDNARFSWQMGLSSLPLVATRLVSAKPAQPRYTPAKSRANHDTFSIWRCRDVAPPEVAARLFSISVKFQHQVHEMTDLYMEAKDCLEDARESIGTTYNQVVQNSAHLGELS